MAKKRLSVRNPSVTGLEEFWYTDDLWTAIGAATITRQASAIASTDSASPIMRIVTTGAAQGAYKDYTVVGNDLVWVTFISLETSEVTTIEAFDQTNGVSIASQAASIDSADVILFAFTVPATCELVRIKITTSSAVTVDIDNFSFARNAIIINPDNVMPSPEDVGGVAQTLNGDRIKYSITTHRRWTLTFNYVTDTMYDRLWELFQSPDTLFYDDGDVPKLTEEFTYYDAQTLSLAGHTKPVSSMASADVQGIATYSLDTRSALPSAVTDYYDLEVETADYNSISVDDGNYFETTNPNDGSYLWHAFGFTDEDWTRAQIQRMSLTVKCESIDSGPAGLHGVVLYAYLWNSSDNALGWVEIARTTNANKNTIEFSTLDADRAQSFFTTENVNPPFTDGPDMWVQLRSRAQRDGSNNLILRTYFIESVWNEGLDSEMTLTHQISLPTDTESADIAVKDKTSGATFTAGTNFTVRDGVTLPTNVVTFVTGQTQGDDITAEYNRFHEVRIQHMPDFALFDDASSNPTRRLTIVLESIKGEN
jgi:hypothetical protein